MLLLTACARSSQEDSEIVSSEQEIINNELELDAVDDNATEPESTDTEEDIIDDRTDEEIIIDGLLYDFDYLVTLIEENTPLIGPIERRLNIDFNEEIESIRDSIELLEIDFDEADSFEDMQRLAAQAFHDEILLEITWTTFSLAHLAPTSQESFVDHFARIQRYMLEDEVSILGYLYYEMYRSDAVNRFYDADVICLETDGLGDFDPNNITTEIISEGEIAYVSIASFMNNIEFDGETLFPFFEKIQNYDHLIIDIRGNFGGYMNHFTHLFMATLTDDVLVVNYPEFFRNTDIVHENVVAYIDSYRIHEGFTGTYISADEFFSNNPMTQMNPVDRELLDYVIEWEIEVEPNEDNIPFNGQIWLLVDELSSSASENAAIFSTSSDFATVVGRETFGVLGAITIMAPLPNTGIIFRVDVGYIPDERGYSQEEFGVSPQHIVPANYDILEYVLNLIRN